MAGKKERELRSVGLGVEGRPYQRILGWFFAFPNIETSLTELCVRTRTSKTAAKGIVVRLEKDGFLRKRVAGRAWLISAVKGHVFLSTKRVAANLALVYDSDILSVVRARVPNARAIVLFGSYRKGDDLPKSDMDIAVEIAGNKPLEIVELGEFPRFGYRTNVKVNLHVFSRKNVDINVFANIANGIILEGFLEVRP